MFYKILETFVTFLIWYSFFLIAFSLGFYIMLHKDIKNSASNSTSSGTDDSEGEVVTKSTIGLLLGIKELILF